MSGSDLHKFTPEKVAKFKAWLTQNGAAVLETTNVWEIVRFMAGNSVSVIYSNTKGVETKKTGEAKRAWEAYRTGGSWRAVKAKPLLSKSSPVIATIRKRDGDRCFYCARLVSQADESIEHIVSRTHGGPNHLSNYALTHNLCNQQAGHLSAMEKIAMHVESIMRPTGDQA